VVGLAVPEAAGPVDAVEPLACDPLRDPLINMDPLIMDPLIIEPDIIEPEPDIIEPEAMLDPLGTGTGAAVIDPAAEDAPDDAALVGPALTDETIELRPSDAEDTMLDNAELAEVGTGTGKTPAPLEEEAELADERTELTASDAEEAIELTPSDADDTIELTMPEPVDARLDAAELAEEAPPDGIGTGRMPAPLAEEARELTSLTADEATELTALDPDEKRLAIAEEAALDADETGTEAILEIAELKEEAPPVGIGSGSTPAPLAEEAIELMSLKADEAMELIALDADDGRLATADEATELMRLEAEDTGAEAILEAPERTDELSTGKGTGKIVADPEIDDRPEEIALAADEPMLLAALAAEEATELTAELAADATEETPEDGAADAEAEELPRSAREDEIEEAETDAADDRLERTAEDGSAEAAEPLRDGEAITPPAASTPRFARPDRKSPSRTV